MKKVSVCIPTYGPIDSLIRCVQSVRECTEYKNYELLIIDDGTNDRKATKHIEKISDRSKILNENTGNANVRNELIQMSKGHYIIQLDSDTIVTPGWMTELIAALEYRWTINNVRIEIAAALLSCQIGYFLNQHNPMNPFDLIQVETVGNACTIFRRDLFNTIGLFDTKLNNLWSDMDFCKRLHSMQDSFSHIAQIVIDPHTIAYHHGWTDEDGHMQEETVKNTRSLPALNTMENKVKHLRSMEIIYERWNVKHDLLDPLKEELTKAGLIK